VGVTRCVPTKEIGPRLGELVPSRRAEGLAGAKPEERALGETPSHSNERRVVRVPRAERRSIERFATHEELAPFAVPPKLHLLDRSFGLEGRKPMQSFGEGARAKRPVDAPQRPVQSRAVAPSAAKTEPRAAQAGAIEEDESQRALQASPIGNTGRRTMPDLG
jgi:hypothetical protein